MKYTDEELKKVFHPHRDDGWSIFQQLYPNLKCKCNFNIGIVHNWKHEKNCVYETNENRFIKTLEDFELEITHES